MGIDSDKEEKYIRETTSELIDNYKDLIKKTFEVTDKDLLQEKIDSENSEESEEKYLNAIKKRRIALDEVDLMIEKIDKLKSKLNTNSDSVSEPTKVVKKYIRQD